MHGCRKCADLEDSIERLVAEYWTVDAWHRQLRISDPDKQQVEMKALKAKNALEEAWKLLNEHVKAAHTHGGPDLSHHDPQIP